MITTRGRAVAWTVAGTVCVVWAALAGSGHGYPIRAPRLSSGAAWLASSAVGALTLLDGSTAEVAGQVRVRVTAVAQQGTDAYVVDAVTGTVRHVDGATMTAGPAITPIPGARAGLQVHATPAVVYAIDTASRRIALLEPRNLATRRAPWTLAAGTTGGVTLDRAGRLWLSDAATGTVSVVTAAGRTTEHRAVGPPEGVLVPAGDRLAVAGATTGTVALLDPESGRVQRRPLAGAGAGGVRPAIGGSPVRRRLHLVADGRLSVCDLDRSGCRAPITLAGAGRSQGAPVEAAGRLFVPDYASGDVLVVDPDARTTVLARTGVLGGADRLTLIARDGMVFFNDPASGRAGVIRPDGRVIAVGKYRTARRPDPRVTVPPTAVPIPPSVAPATPGPAPSRPPGPAPSHAPARFPGPARSAPVPPLPVSVPSSLAPGPSSPASGPSSPGPSSPGPRVAPSGPTAGSGPARPGSGPPSGSPRAPAGTATATAPPGRPAGTTGPTSAGGATAPGGTRIPGMERGARFDYQIAGAYQPQPGVRMVSRDRADAPVPGLFNICYLDAFQTRPLETDWWQSNHDDLLLRERPGGRHLVDRPWGMIMLDVSTEEKRRALADIVGSWITECARAGFDAVEIDNIDSYERSGGRLSADSVVAYLELLAGRAHEAGLAAAQTNAAGLGDRGRRAGLDFAIVEECGRYGDCATYQAVYGDDLIDVEYQPAGLTAACRVSGGRFSVVLRDIDMSVPGSRTYVHETC